MEALSLEDPVSPSKQHGPLITHTLRGLLRGVPIPVAAAVLVLLFINVFFWLGGRAQHKHHMLQRLERETSVDIIDQSLPYYDLVIMIYTTGSTEDVERLSAASQSWLAKPAVMGLNFTYIALVCADDPGSWRLFDNDHAALLPCKHGYKTLVTKGIEGYHYLASHFRFRFAMKTDVDTVVPLECAAQAMLRVDRRKCPSFGMGHWYPPRTSEVWLSGDYPHGPKFGNDAYATDTGNDFYNSYPSGWAIAWSGDIVRYLGMFGATKDHPEWRRTWTVDDAAIGTFLIGLDICQLPMPCHLASSLSASEVQGESKALTDDVTELTIGKDDNIAGFSGPYDDDVPGVGDLANVQAASVGNCAARCLALERCKSFEFSPTAGLGVPSDNMASDGLVRNCQLASSNVASGRKFADFVLYLKEGV